jgi:type IV pilus assembly protein PilA
MDPDQDTARILDRVVNAKPLPAAYPGGRNMSEKSDLLSKIKPLTDPLRILAALGVINAVVLTIVGVATGRLSSFGLACLSLGLGLLIAPSGKPNAIYLRAFRTDKSTAELRAKIAAILGSDFRLSGIRPPRKRTSVFMRFLSPNFFALKYAGSKFMELEAGDDWMARLWKTYQTARLVLIDVRDVTPYVQQEIRLTLQTVGTSRSVFVVDQEKTESEWRRLLAETIGPEFDSAQLRLLDVSPARVTSRQLDSDLMDIVTQLPADLPGELEGGRQFILDHVSEELLRKSGLSFAAMVAAVAALLLSSSLGALRSLSLNDDAELITILVLAAVVVGFFLVLLIRGIFRVGVRARRLEHAGHRDAARRAWFLLLLEVLLFLATPVLTAVEPIQKLLASKKKANEASAVAVLRTLNTVELTYSVTYPDIGYACQLSTLGGNADSGGPRPEAAQLISADLASGQRSGYTFLISNCRTSLVNGRNVYTGYRITAVPTTVSQSGDRGFCTDEGMEIHYDPNGGTNCTEPLQ